MKIKNCTPEIAGASRDVTTSRVQSASRELYWQGLKDVAKFSPIEGVMLTFFSDRDRTQFLAIDNNGYIVKDLSGTSKEDTESKAVNLYSENNPELISPPTHCAYPSVKIPYKGKLCYVTAFTNGKVQVCLSGDHYDITCTLTANDHQILHNEVMNHEIKK